MAYIPCAMVCQHQLTGGFTLLRYGAKEGSGVSFVVGTLLPVEKEEMVKHGLRIVQDALKCFKVWPAETNFQPELTTMGVQARSKFISQNKFVEVYQRDKWSISIGPQHRTGRGWRGVTGYYHEEKHFRLPITQAAFYRELLIAFDRAT